MRQGNSARHRTGRTQLILGLAGIFALLLMVALSACGGETPPQRAAGQTDNAPETTAPTNGDTLAAVVAQVVHVAPEDGGQGDGDRGDAMPVDQAPAQTKATALSPKDVAAALEAAMIGVYRKALPSVVHIRVSATPDDEANRNPFVAPEFLRQGEGSGFVWDTEGHVVTNHHVIDGAESVTVSFADGTQVSATVLGGDADSDLAVLKLDEDVEDLLAIELGDSSQVQVGQTAIAIGAPFGQEFTMTSGIVSAVGRTIRSSATRFTVPEVIQTDTPLNPGNSGGPLLNRLGEVIGINTQIISRSGINAGVGMAVPVNTARRVVPDLIEHGEYEHSWLGISGRDLDPTQAKLTDLPDGTKGVYIDQVQDGSPADKAGLEGSNASRTADGLEYPVGGDIIISVDDAPVAGFNDLVSYLSNFKRPGDSVTMGVIRDGDEIEVEVTLGTRPKSPSQ